MVTSAALALLALSSGALASSNSTTEDERIGWVAPDATRDTWEIIWSCLSIFIVCSWKCVHLNVPSHNESMAEWKKVFGIPYCPSYLLFRKWRRKLVWMFVIAVAPELGVGQAVSQWRTARAELGNGEYRRTGQGTKWINDENIRVQKFTLTHAFYVQMGGILVCDIPGGDAPLRMTQAPIKDADYDAVIATERPVSDDQYIPLHDRIDGNDLERDSVVPKVRLNARIIDSLSELNEMGIVPTISEADIQDRSRADTFSKMFAIVQSTWLVVQTIARAINGLAISQLELATIAFVFCAVVMYYFWWHKPFDVERRHVLIKVPAAGNKIRYVPNWDMQDIDEQGKWIADGRKRDIGVGEFLQLGLRNSAIFQGMDVDEDGWPTVAFYGTGVIFSAIHLAAWNWEFPSPVAQTLWRVFSLIALTASLSPLLVAAVAKLSYNILDTSEMTSTVVTWVMMGIMGIAYFVYIIARLGILVLTFYCLYNMPASTYEKVVWTAWIPHFG